LGKKNKAREAYEAKRRRKEREEKKGVFLDSSSSFSFS
jgi:hypothetical protein